MIAAALHQHAELTNRDWVVDRSQTVGASEIGQCARKVFFSKNEGDHAFGAARDVDYEDGYGARIRGSVYETHWWEPALRRSFGERLLYAGSAQRTFVDGFLSATPDGVIVNLENGALAGLGISDVEGDCIVTDCKTIDPRARLQEAKPEHVYQIQVQIGLVRLKTNLQPTYGLLSYTNASFWSEIKEFAVRFDPAIFAEAQARATRIMTARSSDELRPEGYIAGGKECEFCPFTRPCGAARSGRVPDHSADLDPEAASHIALLAHTAKALKASAEASAAAARAVEQDVRDALAAAGVRKAITDDVTVSWSPIKGRVSWNMDELVEAATAAGVDVTAFRSIGAPSDRLTITLKGEQKATAR